jgi:hypothetical protein
MSIVKKTYGCESKAVFVTAEECKALCESVGLVYHQGLEKRIIAHTITDESQDRSGDVVKAAGVDFKNFYPKNPMVMAFHDYHNLPVGSCVKIWHDAINNAVRAYTIFYDDKIDPSGKSDTIFKMVNAGALKGVSIGFKCGTARRPKDEEERKLLGLGEYGRLIESCELVEYSIVPIPDNGNALTLNNIEGIDQKELELITKSIDSFCKNIDSENTQHQQEPIANKTISVDVSVIDVLLKKIDSLEIMIEKLTAEVKTINEPDISFKSINHPVSVEDNEALKRLNNLFK